MPHVSHPVSGRLRWALLALPLSLLPFGCVKAPDVDFTVPSNGSSGVDASTEITVAFTSALDPETATEVANFIVTGSVSGPHATAAVLDETSKILTITPTMPFASGETVTVSLTSRITTSISIALEAYQFSFRIVGVSAAPELFDDTTGQFLLTSLDPENNSIAVSQRPVLRAEFEKPVFVDTATAGNVTVRGGLTGLRSAEVSVASAGPAGANQTADEVLVQLGSGEPLFEPGEKIIVSYGQGLEAQGEEVTDPALALRPFVATFEARSGEVTGGFSEGLPLTMAVDSSAAPPVQAIFANLLPSDSPELLVLEDSGVVAAYARFGSAPYDRIAELSVGPVVAIAAADFENAGRTDLVVLRPNGVLEVFTLAGQTFRPNGAPIVLAGTQPRDFAVSDLNGDGTLDIVVAVAGGLEFIQKLPVVPGAPSTGFLPIEGDPLVDPVFDLAVGDLDNDGRVDIVCEASSGVVVLRNAGNFLFASVSMLSMVPSRGTLEIADFDGDGFQDVIAGGSGGAFVHLNSGKGIPAPIWSATTIPLGAGVEPTQLAVGNFDGDLNHYPDLIWFDVDGGIPFGMRRKVGEELLDAVIEPLPLSADTPLGGFALADVNRDGARDILVYGRGTGGDPTYLLATTIDVVGGGESAYSLTMTGPSSATLGAGSISLAIAADIGEQIGGFSLALEHDPGFRVAGVTLDSSTFPSGGAEVTTLMGEGTALVTVDLGNSFLMAGDGITLLELEVDLDSVEPGNYAFRLVDEVTLSNDETGSTEFRLEGGGVGIPDLSLAEVDLAVGSSVAPVENLVCSLAGGAPMLTWELPATDVYDAIRIRRNGVLLGDVAGSATAYEDAGAAGGAVYTVAGIRNGLSSLPLSCEPPAIFGTMTCTRQPTNPQNIRLTWSAAGTYASISVRRDGSVISTLPGTSTAFTDFTGDLESHFYQVSGTTVTGDVSSPAVCPDGPVPDDDQTSANNLVPVSSVQLSIDQAIASLTWVNGESYSSIDVLRTSLAGDEAQATLEGSAVSFTEEDLPPDTYTYLVRGNSSVGGDGEFVASNSFQSGPPSPTDVACSLAGGNRVLVTWTNPYPYTALVIERSGSGGTQSIPVPAANETSLIDVDVPDGSYSYTVIGTAEGVDSRSAACSIEVRNLVRVSDFVSTPGHRGKIAIDGQVLDSLAGYSIDLDYDSTAHALGAVSIPGSLTVPMTTETGDGPIKTLTITVEAGDTEVIAAGVNRVFAEVEIETLPTFSAVGTTDLTLSNVTLTTLGPDPMLITPDPTSGEAIVVSNGVFFDPVTVASGAFVEGFIYGTFSEDIAAYQIAITFDPEVVTVEEITEVGTIAALEGGFFPSVDNQLGGAFLGGVGIGEVFPSQARAPLAFVRMQVDPSAMPMVTFFKVEDWVNSDGDSQENLFILTGIDALTPTGLDGRITIVEGVGAPLLTSVEPSNGPIRGGGQVLLSGSHFFGEIDVRFGEEPATASIISDTLILATVPPGVVGTVPVTLTTFSGEFLLPDAYTYSALGITRISPETVSCEQNPILIEGYGFPGRGLEIRIGEAVAEILDVSDDGQQLLVLPPTEAAASSEGITVVDVTATDTGSDQAWTTFGGLRYANEFVRGDMNGDGIVDTLDVLYLSAALSGTGSFPSNIDAADTNDNGVVHSGDLIYLNAFVNGDGPPPPAPFPTAGDDPTPDGIGNCVTP